MRPAQQQLADAAPRDRAVSRPDTSRRRRSSGSRTCSTSSKGGAPRSDTSAGEIPGRYYVRVFGQPGADTWSWRFGGHHVSVHHTIVGGELRAFTPCFLGADPARSPLLGPHELRPLAACDDLAFELLRSLTDAQRGVAVLSPVPPIDLVGANRTTLAEGDGPLRLARVWRNEWTGELLDNLERFQDAEEAKVGLTAAHVDAIRFTTAPKGLAASAMTRGPARDPDGAPRHLRRPPARRDRGARDGQGDGAVVRRPPPRVGGQPRSRAAALLPHPGSSAARRVRQHHPRAPTTSTPCGAIPSATSGWTSSAPTGEPRTSGGERGPGSVLPGRQTEVSAEPSRRRIRCHRREVCRAAS